MTSATTAETTEAAVSYCDKCGVTGHFTVAVCADCGAGYARCEMCAGIAGAKRSLKSHRGLYHPAVVR